MKSGSEGRSDMGIERCRKRDHDIVRKAGQFYLRPAGYFHGLICETCNALFDDPDDSFIKFARSERRKRYVEGEGDPSA